MGVSRNRGFSGTPSSSNVLDLYEPLIGSKHTPASSTKT